MMCVDVVFLTPNQQRRPEVTHTHFLHLTLEASFQLIDLGKHLRV
jgi:hypothetical protein